MRPTNRIVTTRRAPPVGAHVTRVTAAPTTTATLRCGPDNPDCGCVDDTPADNSQGPPQTPTGQTRSSQDLADEGMEQQPATAENMAAAADYTPDEIQNDAEQKRGILDWEQPPGDEPGTLADVMDGTAQQDDEQEASQKAY